MAVLTGIDVVGIQRFVFGSNRLRDVVGASWLIDWATNSKTGALVGLPCGDVLLAAGGNAIVRFDGADAEADSRRFAAQLTRKFFDDAPGVEVVIAHRRYDNGDLAKALRALQVDLAREKLERRPDAPLLGLSVTASCANTGLPAVGFNPRDETAPLSRQALKMGDREVRQSAAKRWNEFIRADRTERDQFQFSEELNELGASSGERSLLGVVHVDGNGIGGRIQKWLEQCIDDDAPDATVLSQYREWSSDLIKLGEDALRAVLERTFGAIAQRPEAGSEKIVQWVGSDSQARELAFRLARKKPNKNERDDADRLPWSLPIRPVLLGGDDMTFLCDGRIALDLAVTALRAMEKRVAYLGNEPIRACAGVAIMPHHSPFVRAYDLAESLCQSAKRAARKLSEDKQQQASFIDWHIGLPKPSQSLAELREREYSALRPNEPKPLSLTCRPYRLGSGPADAGSWTWLVQALLDDPQFGLRGGQWRKHRNKVKALREVLRDGPDAIKDSLKRWRVVTKGLGLVASANDAGFKENGFFDLTRTPLLDALELLDLHLPLEAAAEQKTQTTEVPS